MLLLKVLLHGHLKFMQQAPKYINPNKRKEEKGELTNNLNMHTPFHQMPLCYYMWIFFHKSKLNMHKVPPNSTPNNSSFIPLAKINNTNPTKFSLIIK